MSFHEILQNQANNWADVFVHDITCNSITAATGIDSGATGTISVGWTGCWATGITGTIYIAREGNIVNITVAAVSGTGTAANSIVCPNGTLGAFAPLSNKVYPYHITSNTVGAVGLFEVYANGSMAFFATPSGGAFATSGVNSFTGGSISYNLLG